MPSTRVSWSNSNRKNPAHAQKTDGVFIAGAAMRTIGTSFHSVRSPSPHLPVGDGGDVGSRCALMFSGLSLHPRYHPAHQRDVDHELAWRLDGRCSNAGCPAPPAQTRTGNHQPLTFEIALIPPPPWSMSIPFRHPVGNIHGVFKIPSPAASSRSNHHFFVWSGFPYPIRSSPLMAMLLAKEEFLIAQPTARWNGV